MFLQLRLLPIQMCSSQGISNTIIILNVLANILNQELNNLFHNKYVTCLNQLSWHSKTNDRLFVPDQEMLLMHAPLV